jgi:hypothetical protein
MPTTGEPTLEQAAFRVAIGTPFVVRLPDGTTVELTLVAVERGPSRPGWERFTLLFDGPAPATLPHLTYVVEHASLGTFPLFVGPVVADEGSPRYEAVFNRPAPEGVHT